MIRHNYKNIQKLLAHIRGHMLKDRAQINTTASTFFNWFPKLMQARRQKILKINLNELFLIRSLMIIFVQNLRVTVHLCIFHFRQGHFFKLFLDRPRAEDDVFQAIFHCISYRHQSCRYYPIARCYQSMNPRLHNCHIVNQGNYKFYAEETQANWTVLFCHRYWPAFDTVYRLLRICL